MNYFYTSVILFCFFVTSSLHVFSQSSTGTIFPSDNKIFFKSGNDHYPVKIRVPKGQEMVLSHLSVLLGDTTRYFKEETLYELIDYSTSGISYFDQINKNEFKPSDKVSFKRDEKVLVLTPRSGGLLYRLNKVLVKDDTFQATIDDIDFVVEIPEEGEINYIDSKFTFGIMTVPLKSFFGASTTLVNEDGQSLGTTGRLLSEYNINATFGLKFQKVKISRFSKNVPEKSWLDDRWLSTNILLGTSRNRVQFDIFETSFNSFTSGLALGYHVGPLATYLTLAIDRHFGDDIVVDNFQNNLWLGLGVGLAF
ncbi:MAG: hypothetical protein LAT68_04540 [Cyclobacteriaceae bacterium]|nr:hypothetical protein [Cyclobacteriaceae bacterium]MCH8515578.1 hypothetical protein [Cyclobacteriaceae bacterium]